MKNQRGITLVSLVITIIILIILAAVGINFAIGENGIITKAKEAKKAQIVAEAKEKIGTEILSAQVEAIERKEGLEQAQVEDIISNYGQLQADGDTIILNDNGYEVSLLDIYTGTTTTKGSYSESQAKIALLENQVATLQQQLEDSNKTQSEASAELSELKTTLSQATATQDKILKDYTAYSNGQLTTGTIENYAGQTIPVGETSSDDTYTYINIPQPGYYDTSSKISMLKSNLDNNFLESITGIGTANIASTTAYSYTIPESGIYDISATGNHVADSCPGGTGRYYFSMTYNGTTLDSYGGNHTARKTLTVTKFFKEGDIIYFNSSTACSDCSYTHSNESSSITVNKWVFETE